MMFLAFGGMAEVPIAVQVRRVVLKQVAARMYGIPSFVLSTAIVYLPLAIADCTIFGSLVYWMTGFSNEPGRYFFFLLIVLAVGCDSCDNHLLLKGRLSQFH
jgi:ABC-type multidrug transport system permease subunit